MEALGIALLIVLVAGLVLVGIIAAMFVGVFLFACLPLAIGIPLGILANEVSTPLGVVIILISLVAELFWATMLNERWP